MATPELLPLSPTLLAGHLACAHLTQLERRRRAGELNIDFNPDPRLEAMRRRGQEHEAEFVRSLQNEGRDICDLRGKRNVSETCAAMHRGHDVIVQAPLANAVFQGVADVLLRVSKHSVLGDYSYEP